MYVVCRAPGELKIVPNMERTGPLAILELRVVSEDTRPCIETGHQTTSNSARDDTKVNPIRIILLKSTLTTLQAHHKSNDSSLFTAPGGKEEVP